MVIGHTAIAQGRPNKGAARSETQRKLPPVVGLKRAEIVRRVGATLQGYLDDA